jgi:hypothetical protein
MDYFVGLEVSVKDTSVCIVDETGKIVREVAVATCKAYKGEGSVKNPKCKGRPRPGEIIRPASECDHCDGSAVKESGARHGPVEQS